MNIVYSDTSISITFPSPLDFYAVAEPEIESDLPLLCNHNPDGTPCDVCTGIADIEAQIDSLPSPSAELQESHRTLRSQRNNLCPISKLSYDILSDIFILSLPPIIHEFMAEYEPPCSDFPMPRLPLRLSAVCSSWRQLACSTPQLWSTLSINIFQTKAEHVSHRFQYSRSVPLRVQLSVPRFATSSHSHESQLALISLVKQNLHRIAFLCLNLPCKLINSFLQDSNIPNALLVLEELHFHCLVSGFRGMCSEPHNFILSADPPAPHKLHMTSTSLSNIHLNWDALRHLTLETTRSSHSSILVPALTLLSNTSQLYVLDLIFLPDPDPTTAPTVIQNSIRVLRLFHASEKVLAQLTLPHLESLKLWSSYPDPTTNHLLSFLQRSACSLTTMMWKPSQMTSSVGQALINVFKCTPKLERLSLFVSVHNDDQPSEVHVVPFLESLSAVGSASEPFLLPLLQEFVYTGPLLHAPLRLFIDVAEKRLEPTSGTSESVGNGDGGGGGDHQTKTIRPFKGLAVFYFPQALEEEEEEEEEEGGTITIEESIDTADQERILMLNGHDEKDTARFAVLEYNEVKKVGRSIEKAL